MRKIFMLLLPATIILVGQYSCSSSKPNNAPANQSSAAQPVSESPATNNPNTMPSPASPNQTSTKTVESVAPEVVMQYTQLFTAEMKNDRAKADNLLAANYQETTGDGKTLNKAAVLAQLTPDRKFDTYSLDNVKSTLNGNTGTVTGRASVIRSGKTETWQFTCTMKKENGKWVATETKISNYKKA